MSFLRRVFSALALIATLSLAAQAQDSHSRLRLATPGFVFALYAARGLGPAGGFVAMVQNPETQYRELIVGALMQLNWKGQSVLVALA